MRERERGGEKGGNLSPNLLEGSLCQQMSLDPGEGLMRIVVCLLNKPQLLALGLVQTAFHTEGSK